MDNFHPPKVALWKQVLLVLFLVDIMVIYPGLNRVQEDSLANRLFLLVIIIGVFLAFHKRWVSTLRTAKDIGTTLMIAYFVWIFLLMAVSIIIGDQSPSSIFTYGLNSFAPLVLYGCFVRFPARKLLIVTIIWLSAINILIGIITYQPLGLSIPGLSQVFEKWVFDPESYRLVSIAGKSTVIGYLAVLGFTWILFFNSGPWRYGLLLLFVVAVLLSFQRSMWFGLILALFFYLINNRISKRSKIHLGAVVVTFFLLLFVTLPRSIDISQVSKLVSDRMSEFNFEDAFAERSSQQKLFNTDNVVLFLTGEGYGKYSPLNKDENLINLPDAPYHMIVNETGLVGLTLFISMLAAFFLRAMRRGNVFQLWFVLHLAISLVGSRILWYFPLNFLIIIMLAMLKDDLLDTSMSLEAHVR
jgi:hypothetical protein